MNSQPAAASDDLYDGLDSVVNDEHRLLPAVDHIRLWLAAVAVQHPLAIGHEELGAERELDFAGYVV